MQSTVMETFVLESRGADASPPADDELESLPQAATVSPRPTASKTAAGLR
jgi:hypothetical protein